MRLHGSCLQKADEFFAMTESSNNPRTTAILIGWTPPPDSNRSTLGLERGGRPPGGSKIGHMVSLSRAGCRDTV